MDTIIHTTKVNYKGISSAIRRAVNTEKIKGKINISAIRHHLPAGKQNAPEKVILKSLKYLAKGNEIQEKNGVFSTKALAATKPDQVTVTGTLVKTRTSKGKLLVTIETTNLNIG